MINFTFSQGKKVVEQLQRLSPEGADSQATAEVCIEVFINEKQPPQENVNLDTSPYHFV